MEKIGRAYLDEVHRMEPLVRAMSLSSYEDEGLPQVFRAMLKARDWDEPSLGAFRHFQARFVIRRRFCLRRSRTISRRTVQSG